MAATIVIPCRYPNRIISDKIDSGRYGKHFGVLNRVIVDIIRQRKITFGQFTQMVHEVYKDISRPEELAAIRNNIFGQINGTFKFGPRLFIFIMEKILKEPIPDDPELKQILLIGAGEDLRGQKFGRLTVISCTGKTTSNHLRWNCKCDCGSEAEREAAKLKYDSDNQSCGCLGNERRRNATIERYKKAGQYHGMTDSPERYLRKAMLRRCYNPEDISYKNYGGRGITVCDRWRESFKNFIEDMGPRPEGMTLDRIDNDGPYCKENCKWATRDEQEYNKRKTVFFEDGTPLGLWIKQNGLHENKARFLFRKGRSKEAILEELNKCN